jgi:hypothetical protein
MYLRVPCDVFKYAFMCTGTPASYAVCQASSSLILSILASYAVCQIALTAAIATVLLLNLSDRNRLTCQLGKFQESGNPSSAASAENTNDMCPL